MNIIEEIEFTKLIDQFLREIYNSTLPLSLAKGIEKKQIASKENELKFKKIEYILEELELVELISGRDNSTLNGQCEYIISKKGREIIEHKKSVLFLLMERITIESFFGKENWDAIIEDPLEKRANEADFFLDMIIEKKIINLDKTTLRKYFKEWFRKSHEFDLQIDEEGDLCIEDGDFKIVPDFSKDNIPEFLNWFEEEGNKFMDYLKSKGMNVKKDSKQEIVNHGNLILNNNSEIKEQLLGKEKEPKKDESNWTKANIIVTIIVSIITAIGVIWQILK